MELDFQEELFDIFYYIIAIANDYNIDLEEIFHIKDKINKEKYERSFSLEEARKEYEKNTKQNTAIIHTGQRFMGKLKKTHIQTEKRRVYK